MMPQIRFGDDAIEVDAAVIASGLGIAAELVQTYMREGRITSLCERGVGDDAGTSRLSFFMENKRLRLIVDDAGDVIRQSALTSPDRPLSPGRSA